MTPDMADNLYRAWARLERAEHLVLKQEALIAKLPAGSKVADTARALLDQFVALERHHRMFLILAIAAARSFSDSQSLRVRALGAGIAPTSCSSWDLIQELNGLVGSASLQA